MPFGGICLNALHPIPRMHLWFKCRKSSILHFTWNHIGVAAQLCQDLSVAWSPHQLSLSAPPFKMLSGKSDVEDDVENWKKKFCLGKKYIFVVMIRADANKGVTHCGGISGHLAPRKLYIVNIFTKGLISQIERWVKYFFSQKNLCQSRC